MFEIYVRRPEMPAGNSGKPKLLTTFETSREAEIFVQDAKAKHPHLRFLIVNKITEKVARSFWADLLGTIHSNGSSGIMSTELIADHMHISVDKAEDFMRACLKAGLTDRSCGSWVV